MLAACCSIGREEGAAREVAAARGPNTRVTPTTGLEDGDEVGASPAAASELPPLAFPVAARRSSALPWCCSCEDPEAGAVWTRPALVQHGRSDVRRAGERAAPSAAVEVAVESASSCFGSSMGIQAAVDLG